MNAHQRRVAKRKAEREQKALDKLYETNPELKPNEVEEEFDEAIRRIHFTYTNK